MNTCAACSKTCWAQDQDPQQLKTDSVFFARGDSEWHSEPPQAVSRVPKLSLPLCSAQALGNKEADNVSFQRGSRVFSMKNGGQGLREGILPLPGFGQWVVTPLGHLRAPKTL